MVDSDLEKDEQGGEAEMPKLLTFSSISPFTPHMLDSFVPWPGRIERLWAITSAWKLRYAVYIYLDRQSTADARAHGADEVRRKGDRVRSSWRCQPHIRCYDAGHAKPFVAFLRPYRQYMVKSGPEAAGMPQGMPQTMCGYMALDEFQQSTAVFAASLIATLMDASRTTVLAFDRPDGRYRSDIDLRDHNIQHM